MKNLITLSFFIFIMNINAFCQYGESSKFAFHSNFKNEKKRKKVVIDPRLEPFVYQFIKDARIYLKKSLVNELYSLESIKTKRINKKVMGVTRKIRGIHKVVLIQPFKDEMYLKQTLYHELVHALLKIDSHLLDSNGSLINESSVKKARFIEKNWDAYVKKLFLVDIPYLESLEIINKKRIELKLKQINNLEEAEEWYSSL